MKRPFLHNCVAIRKQAFLLRMKVTTTFKTIQLDSEQESQVEKAEKLLNEAVDLLEKINK